MDGSKDETHGSYQSNQTAYGYIDPSQFFCESDFESDSDSEDSNISDEQRRKKLRKSLRSQFRSRVAPTSYMDSILALMRTKPFTWKEFFHSPMFIQRDNGLWARKTPYLSLPGEIRNRIMDYALSPGEVYLATKADPANWTGSKTSTSGCEGTTSVCQILATCKQLYMEGHEAYYAGNSFHLPPGPVEGFLKWYEALRPNHRDLIRSVTIDFSILDLTPSVLEQCESSYRERYKQSMTQSNYTRAKYDTLNIVIDTLRDLWIEKMAEVYRLQAFLTVKLVALNLGGEVSQRRTLLPDPVMTLKGDAIDRVLTPMSAMWNALLEFRSNPLVCFDPWKHHMDVMMVSTADGVRVEIMKHFDGLASCDESFCWPAFKRWLRDLEITDRRADHLALLHYDGREEDDL